MTFSAKASDWILLSPELFLTAAGLLMLRRLGVSREVARGVPGLPRDALGRDHGDPRRLRRVAAGADDARSSAAPSSSTTSPSSSRASSCSSILLTILASVRFVGEAPYPGGEYYALLLFAGVGMLFMASGNNLITIYVSLETMALSSYILAGYFKGEVKSTEAALKYFILGAFSSGVLLYGLSLVYGVSGKMGLPELAKLFATTERSNMLMLGILLILAGLLFKIAAVPFHVWTPDVYEGSPTPVTAFFSVGPKVAAYAILARIFYVAFAKFHADWGLVVALVSAATMILGNVAALLQTNVKRMLAYSSIANAGYALLGVLGFCDGLGAVGDPDLPARLHLHELRGVHARDPAREQGLRRRVGLGLQRPRRSATCRRRS